MKQALATACTTLFTILRSGTNNRDSVVLSRLVGLRSRLILSRMSSSTTDSTTGNQYDIVVDPFCFRQFEESEKAKVGTDTGTRQKIYMRLMVQVHIPYI